MNKPNNRRHEINDMLLRSYQDALYQDILLSSDKVNNYLDSLMRSPLNSGTIINIDYEFLITLYEMFKKDEELSQKFEQIFNRIKNGFFYRKTLLHLVTAETVDSETIFKDHFKKRIDNFY